MFLLSAALFVLVALIHGARQHRSKDDRIELVLVYLLGGYHGAIMIAVALYILLRPDAGAEMLNAPAGNVFQEFMGWAYLGMAVASTLVIWVRGRYLLGPIVYWTVYFLGATWIHWQEFAEAGNLTAGWAFRIVLSHALLPIVMVGLWIWCQRLRRAPGAGGAANGSNGSNGSNG